MIEHYAPQTGPVRDDRLVDKRGAGHVADAVLAQLRAEPYQVLVDRYLDKNESVIGESGSRYQIEVDAFWNRGKAGDLRIVVSVDDGGFCQAATQLP